MLKYFLALCACVMAVAATAPAADTRCTDKGLSIDAGDGGVWTLSYPRLLDPVDKGSGPEQITVKPDGSGASMTYAPSGQLTIDQQRDGSWLVHVWDIPEPVVKFSFGYRIAPERIAQGVSWSADDAAAQDVPKTKDQVHLYQGNPRKFSLLYNGAGFALLYPIKTWTVLDDQRVWGKDFVGLGCIYYFPNKKHVPEISWTFSVGKPDAAMPATRPAMVMPTTQPTK